MIKNILTKFVFISLFFCFSCSDDDMNQIEENLNLECSAISNLGEISILEESKNFLPYPDTISKIIFTDSIGQEYEGNVKTYKTHLAEAFNPQTKPCPIDSSIQITYRWVNEMKDIYIEFDSLDLKLRVSISPVLDYEDYSQKLVADICRFTLYYNPGNFNIPNSRISIITNQRNHPNPLDSFSDFYDEFEIHGKIYEQVYVKNADLNQNQEFKLYYNNQFGIVGFKDETTPNGIDLKFDRFE
jgi:hypothetical protein